MKINVTRPSLPPHEEYCAELRSLWSTRWLTNMGAKHRELQSELSHRLDAPNLDLLTNGHMAIELTLQALGLTGEVITTPFTFASTTHAIVRAGLTPVFCDIDPVTFTLDPTKIEPLITERTTAILPVHVYGTICDVEAIDRIARAYGLKVVYDAAHAFGVQYKGRGAAAYGDASCFSFHATKVFHTIEGGVVCYKNEDFGHRLNRLKNFGLDGEDALEAGCNAKMDEFRAAMGLCNLRHFEEETSKRKCAAEHYRARLEGVPGIQLAAVQTEAVPNYAYFPAVFHPERFGADRDRVLEALAANGVMARKYFYPLTSAFSCYRSRFDPSQTPVALDISQKVLCLPLFADITTETVDQICDIILDCGRLA